jgi:hypothetical protein
MYLLTIQYFDIAVLITIKMNPTMSEFQYGCQVVIFFDPDLTFEQEQL